METAAKKTPGIFEREGLLEYLLVAHPSPVVCAMLELEKKSFTKEYNQAIAIKTKPRITIADFLAIEEMEPTINRWIQNICSSISAFPVSLNNYSGFPPHTVYLRIQNQLPFKMLGKKLKPVADFINSSGCPPCKITSNLHLSIARRLPEEVYNKAMADYSQKTFHESFMLDELLLLRRGHQYDKCKIIQVFKLKPASNDVFSDIA